MVSSKLPTPTESSSELEVLQYELAQVYEAFKASKAEVKELETEMVRLKSIDLSFTRIIHQALKDKELNINRPYKVQGVLK